MGNLTSLPKEIEDLPKLSKLNLRFNPNLEGISSELKKNGLTIWKSRFTKFINYKYYTNQLSTVTVKRKNLPRIPPKIRENIARKVNTKPNTKNEANRMNVARSSLRAYNNKQKVLTRNKNINKNLKKLSFEYNNLTSIPKEIGLCKNLKDLDLSGNNLTSLPKEIEDLPKLSKLNLRF